MEVEEVEEVEEVKDSEWSCSGAVRGREASRQRGEDEWGRQGSRKSKSETQEG
jgi:hypothetical protein